MNDIVWAGKGVWRGLRPKEVVVDYATTGSHSLQAGTESGYSELTLPLNPGQWRRARRPSTGRKPPKLLDKEVHSSCDRNKGSSNVGVGVVSCSLAA